MLNSKKILIIYQPWRKFSEGLHQPMIENLNKFWKVLQNVSL